MSKRRVFDIDFTPESSDPVPAEPPARRGPMASAIAEAAGAVEAREDTESLIRAENDRLAHEHVRLKKAGLIVDLIPVAAIRTDKLTRDRVPTADGELAELIESIRAVGLSNPIRVEAAEDGTYELIQGFRRLSAYRALLQETGDARYDQIPAGLTAKGETLEKLYRRMVDENLVRKDVSFGEMAALAWSYVRDGQIQVTDINDAVDRLYASASRQKRSYIKHFAFVLRRLETQLEHVESIPRALGLRLAKQLRDHPTLLPPLQAALEAEPGRPVSRELELLDATAQAKPELEKVSPVRPAGTAKTSFRMQRPEGIARCIAANGKVELKLERDFSALERHRLEAAIEAFFTALDQATSES